MIRALILRVIFKMFDILYLIILIRVLCSWVYQSFSQYSWFRSIFSVVYNITEPFLAPFRNILPNLPIDISPILLYFVIELIKNILMRVLFII